MIIELHMLQNFAPSNLNRDDTGTPKNSEFGGHRRARISSQCQKRAIRTLFAKQLKEFGLTMDDLAERTRLVVAECVKRLVAKGKPEDQARAVVGTLLAGANLKIEDNETEYLLFLGRREIEALKELALAHWDALTSIISSSEAQASAGKQKTKKDAKKEAAARVTKEIKGVKEAIQTALNAGKAIDLALFGRMVADLAEINSDAACQVAHAVSTNRVNVEFDYFTAVDDLQPKQDAGAGMIGTIEFNSACYYRYASVDLEQLKKNLQDDQEQAHKALRAFIQAMIEAVPTGKQNSFAAHNPPSLIAVVVRNAGQWNLVNAFAKPITPKGEQSLIDLSIAALDTYWGGMTTMYGTKRLRGAWVVSNEVAALPNLAPTAEDNGAVQSAMRGERVANVDTLIERVMTAVKGSASTGAA